MTRPETGQDQPESPDRREFIKKSGRFAAAAPPAVAFLLSTSLASEAVALSGGTGGMNPQQKRILRKLRKLLGGLFD